MQTVPHLWTVEQLQGTSTSTDASASGSHSVDKGCHGYCGATTHNQGRLQILPDTCGLRYQICRGCSLETGGRQVNLPNIFACFGVLETILSDNGSNFVAEVTKELLKHMQCTHITYHPQSNGMVERVNGILKKVVDKIAGQNGSRSYQLS